MAHTDDSMRVGLRQALLDAHDAPEPDVAHIARLEALLRSWSPQNGQPDARTHLEAAVASDATAVADARQQTETMSLAQGPFIDSPARLRQDTEPELAGRAAHLSTPNVVRRGPTEADTELLDEPADATFTESAVNVTSSNPGLGKLAPATGDIAALGAVTRNEGLNQRHLRERLAMLDPNSVEHSHVKEVLDTFGAPGQVLPVQWDDGSRRFLLNTRAIEGSPSIAATADLLYTALQQGDVGPRVPVAFAPGNPAQIARAKGAAVEFLNLVVGHRFEGQFTPFTIALKLHDGLPTVNLCPPTG